MLIVLYVSHCEELLLRDGGFQLLLGASGSGSEGALRRFLPDPQSQRMLLLDAARQCQESGLYDKVGSCFLLCSALF